jgi:predicted ATPase/transcriptional regulator with XRE-family HTH domain
MDEATTFGQWLRQHRHALDLTQEELAEHIGCSDVTVRKIESGARRPSKQMVELIALYFQVPEGKRSEFLALARGVGPGAVDAGTLLVPRALPPSNLPARLVDLIGREEMLGQVCRYMMKGDVRLLTLTGPPGIGKTSLALHAARRLLPSFTGGAWFVPLAPISDPALVTTTIVGALGSLPRVSQPALETLVHHLRDRYLLLVLDNFEQVVGAALDVAEILARCSNIKILVTSRAPLHLRGERQFQVQPLEVPQPRSATKRVKDLAAFGFEGVPSVRLFMERARAVSPDFELTEENKEAVASICTQLDGLPLAIELAAAKVRILTPGEIVTRLDKRLNLLAGGPRDLPVRQQTLRGAIDWSYMLLNEGEQVLLCRLGVFRGGWTLTAAEAICNERGDIPLTMLDGLMRLLDESLLKRAVSGHATRYSMLETIREYALERLETVGGLAVLERLHAEYFLALATSARAVWDSRERHIWLKVLEAEHDNLRGAMSWALASGEVDIAARFVSCLWLFWYHQGHVNEGQHWFEAVLEKEQDIDLSQLAAVFAGAGTLAWLAHEHHSARDLHERSLAISRNLGKKDQVAASLRILGNLARDTGDYQRAGRFYSESMTNYRELNDQSGIAYLLISMGESARSQHNYSEAMRLYEESLEMLRTKADNFGIMTCFGNQAHIEYEQGKHDSSTQFFQQALKIAISFENYQVIASYLAGLGGIARLKSNPMRGVRLLSASHSILERGNLKLYRLDELRNTNDVEILRAQLSEAEWQKAWRDGEEMSLDEAIEYALQEPSGPHDSSGPATAEHIVVEVKL